MIRMLPSGRTEHAGVSALAVGIGADGGLPERDGGGASADRTTSDALGSNEPEVPPQAASVIEQRRREKVVRVSMARRTAACIPRLLHEISRACERHAR
jgi:hypothetical protein